MEIDPKTGILKTESHQNTRKCKKVRFPTYPYIGSNYGKYSPAILFVGLDKGKDEKEHIQDFNGRNSSIEKKEFHLLNPHIAGTYFTALHFLEKNLNWGNKWNEIGKTHTCQQILKNKKDCLPEENPLSHISLTNFYKFVDVGRNYKSGGKNRKHYKKDIEQEFFIKEVNIFNPDIIIFQSLEFNRKEEILSFVSTNKRTVYVGPHPSYRGKKRPAYFVEQYEKK